MLETKQKTDPQNFLFWRFEKRRKNDNLLSVCFWANICIK